MARQAHKAAGRRTGDAMLAVIPVPDPQPHIAQDPDPQHYTQNSLSSYTGSWSRMDPVICVGTVV